LKSELMSVHHTAVEMLGKPTLWLSQVLCTNESERSLNSKWSAASFESEIVLNALSGLWKFLDNGNTDPSYSNIPGKC
jgi:hypothetical protein